jgi:lipoprotein-releasing system permease protein
VRYELKIALRYLRARRKQAFISVTTVFTAVGVMIGVAALTITLAVMGGFEQSLKNRVLSLSPQVQILSTQGSIIGYQALQKRADSVPGVSGSDPFIVGQGMLSSGRGIGGVIVRGIEPANRVVDEEWDKYVVAGSLQDLAKVLPVRAPTSQQQATAAGIAIGSDLAQKLKVKLGDPVRMVAPIMTTTETGDLSTRSGDYRVAAIFESGMIFMDSQMTFVDLAQAQQFFGRPGRVDGIDVHLVNLGETAAVTVALRKLLKEPYVVRNWIEYNQSAAAGFEILKRVYSLVLVLLIGVAAFNLVATLIMVVMEKRKDIAVLLAMGAKRRDVWRIFVLKGLVVGGAGTAAGLLLGATGCFALARYQFIHIPKQIYGISTVPIAVNPINFVLVALASLALCLVATFYPAARAARAMPVEVFRS